MKPQIKQQEEPDQLEYFVRPARMKKERNRQEKLVREWNEKYPVGTPVIVTKDDETEIRAVTTHEATMLGGHTAVAWLKDIRGCYSLERVRADMEKMTAVK